MNHWKIESTRTPTQSALLPAAFTFLHLARAIAASRALAFELILRRGGCASWPSLSRRSLAPRALAAAAILARASRLMYPRMTGSGERRRAESSACSASMRSFRSAARRSCSEEKFMFMSAVARL